MGGFVENLKRRAEIIRTIRAFFDNSGFTEVATPVLISAPAPEPHIDCPPCGKGFLRASPELQMKKLLAAGMDKIYQIGPCFRDGELGARHNPEFTMIEWYRLGATYLDIADDAEALLREIMPDSAVPTRITVREAYLNWAGWDPWTEWNQDRFDFDMAAKIEPSLPKAPVFLMDYPKEAASLARLRGDVAERWELYIGGVELANCFIPRGEGGEAPPRGKRLSRRRGVSRAPAACRKCVGRCARRRPSRCARARRNRYPLRHVRRMTSWRLPFGTMARR